jgi:hypothetical protein
LQEIIKNQCYKKVAKQQFFTAIWFTTKKWQQF